MKNFLLVSMVYKHLFYIPHGLVTIKFFLNPFCFSSVWGFIEHMYSHVNKCTHVECAEHYTLCIHFPDGTNSQLNAVKL